MFALLFSTGLSVFIYIVLGILFAKSFNLHFHFSEIIIIGLVFSNVFSTILSIFIPVNQSIYILLIITCIFLLFYLKKEVIDFSLLAQMKKDILFFSLPFICIGFILTLNAPQIYDSGLYHIQSIKWIEEYAAVPGLANLHGRFGFNSNLFTLFALTSFSNLFKQDIFSINFIVFSVFVLYFINIIYGLLREKGINNLFIFYSILFYFLLYLSNILSSPSPDFLAAVIPTFIFTRVIELSSIKEGITIRKITPVIILSAYILTVKIATLPILILPIILFLKYKNGNRNWLLITLSLGLIITPWIVRNIILTGWLIYPFPDIHLFNFDWQVPLLNVIEEKNAIIGWARNPGEHYLAPLKMGILEWVLIWWQKVSIFNKLIFMPALFSPFIAISISLINKIKIDFITYLIIIASFLGVSFWLFSAPDFRFGLAFIVISAFSPFLYLKFSWQQKHKPPFLFTGLITIIGCCFAMQNMEKIISTRRNFASLVISPEHIKTPNNIIFNSYKINGTTIYFPLEGDRCFDHCLPCSIYKHDDLELRGCTLQSGFRKTSGK